MQQGASTQELLSCPFCDGPTVRVESMKHIAPMVRHEGRPHCPVARYAITVEQWQHRIEHTPSDRNAASEDAVALVWKLWGQFYDKTPPGDPKDTARALITAIRALTTTPEPTANRGGQVDSLALNSTQSGEGPTVATPEPTEPAGVVERLREGANSGCVPASDLGDFGILDEAADLIERLSHTPPLLEVAKEALENIANPIGAMQRQAKLEGNHLNGAVAMQLANDAEYLKGLARQALAAIQAIKGAEQ